MIIQLIKECLIHHGQIKIAIQKFGLVIAKTFYDFRNTQQRFAYKQIFYERSVREVYDHHGQLITHLDNRLAELQASFKFITKKLLNLAVGRVAGLDLNKLFVVTTPDLRLLIFFL